MCRSSGRVESLPTFVCTRAQNSFHWFSTPTKIFPITLHCFVTSVMGTSDLAGLVLNTDNGIPFLVGKCYRIIAVRLS